MPNHLHGGKALQAVTRRNICRTFSEQVPNHLWQSRAFELARFRRKPTCLQAGSDQPSNHTQLATTAASWQNAHWWLLITIMLVGQGRLFQCTNSGACTLEGRVVWDTRIIGASGSG